MRPSFVPHEIEWTDETIADYWNCFSSRPEFHGQYFSFHSGESILDYVSPWVPWAGRVLDFGCGPGFMIGHLLRKGVACKGLDFSAGSVATVNRNFAGMPGFGGAIAAEGFPTPLPTTSIDVVVCVEVVEHLPDQHLGPTLREIHRLLRPEGWVVMTTPNDENMNAGRILCPDCGCLFHRYQHMRTWTQTSIVAAMEELGFVTMHCRATTFGPKRRWARLRKVYRFLREGREQPHLVYIGRKAVS